ncbi:hypothetical protein Hsc_1494 [Herbaspirillum seropedicae]|nr:hypothetical protein Hsc_1494 [Herbaspirillum seropedicae]
MDDHFPKTIARLRVADISEALHRLELATQADHLDAINFMGRSCGHGWGRQYDTTMAVYWCRVAASRRPDWDMYNQAQPDDEWRWRCRGPCYCAVLESERSGHARWKT